MWVGGWGGASILPLNEKNNNNNNNANLFWGTRVNHAQLRCIIIQNTGHIDLHKLQIQFECTVEPIFQVRRSFI